MLSPLALLTLLQPLDAAAATTGTLVEATAATAPEGAIDAALSSAQQAFAAAAVVDPNSARLVAELADLDAKTAATIAVVLRPVLSISTLLMIVRIVLSWYPQVCTTPYLR